MRARRLTAADLGEGPLDVARRLVGATLVSTLGTDADGAAGGDVVAVRLTEVEAYAGADDPGSHAFRGPTPRNGIMFGPPGRLYVYFSYGMHWCANVVCAAAGEPAAVLLRAGEVVRGEALASTRRPACRRAVDLARGPGRLTAALGITGRQDGLDLTDPESPVWIEASSGPVVPLGRGPRVGVSGPGGDGERFPWRIWTPGDPTVSAYRPGRSSAAPPPTR